MNRYIFIPIYILALVIIYVISWFAMYRLYGFTHDDWECIRNGVHGTVITHSNCFSRSKIEICQSVDLIWGGFNQIIDMAGFEQKEDWYNILELIKDDRQFNKSAVYLVKYTFDKSIDRYTFRIGKYSNSHIVTWGAINYVVQ